MSYSVNTQPLFDFDPNASKEDLHKLLRQWSSDRYCREVSDPRFYTSGRKALYDDSIHRLEDFLKETD